MHSRLPGRMSSGCHLAAQLRLTCTRDVISSGSQRPASSAAETVSRWTRCEDSALSDSMASAVTTSSRVGAAAACVALLCHLDASVLEPVLSVPTSRTLLRWMSIVASLGYVIQAALDALDADLKVHGARRSKWLAVLGRCLVNAELHALGSTLLFLFVAALDAEDMPLLSSFASGLLLTSCTSALHAICLPSTDTTSSTVPAAKGQRRGLQACARWVAAVPATAAFIAALVYMLLSIRGMNQLYAGPVDDTLAVVADVLFFVSAVTGLIQENE